MWPQQREGQQQHNEQKRYGTCEQLVLFGQEKNAGE
jgi:hypothetical protein